MAENKLTYDVFISHSTGDTRLAEEIARECRLQGLVPATYMDLLPAKDPGDGLWEALAESRALLVILSPDGPTPNMAIEVGAARAWNKPIFGVVTDPSYNRLQPGFAGIHLYPAGRIDDVIRAIRLGGQDLSDEDRRVLMDLYHAIGVPVDRLSLEPHRLEELVRRFTSGSGKIMPGERLLSELFRLRKQGRLTRSRPADRSAHPKGTA